MKFNTVSAARPRWVRAAAVATLGAAALAAAGAAQARDNVFWSVGLASPGVQVGVSNGQQFYGQVAPVYVQPAPVYVQPAPVYVQPAPVYYRPAPVAYQQAPVVLANYGYGGYGYGGYGYGYRPQHHHRPQFRDFNHDGRPDGGHRH